MKKLSIVVPLYNSEKSVGYLVERLIELYEPSCELQIVLVNDRSKDRTDHVCKALHSRYPNIVTYIRLAKNFGEHNAVMAGMHYADGDYCVTMDDDLQNPPEEIGRLVEEIEKGYDVVYTYYSDKKHAWIRNMGSKFNDKVANIILNKPHDLYLSSFKIINRFIIDELVKHESHEPYVDGIILQSTDNIGKVKVRHMERKHGRSGYTFRKLIGLWGNIVVNYSMLPIRIVGVIGILVIIFSISYSIYKAIDYGQSWRLTEFETLMSANLFFRGLVLLAVSILGEYVGRIYLSLNHEPQFVVREVLTAHVESKKVKYLKDVRPADERAKG